MKNDPKTTNVIQNEEAHINVSAENFPPLQQSVSPSTWKEARGKSTTKNKEKEVASTMHMTNGFSLLEGDILCNDGAQVKRDVGQCSTNYGKGTSHSSKENT